MALILCMECGKQISDQASSCPHCGLPLRASAAVPPANPPPAPPAKRSHATAYVIILLGGVALFALMMFYLLPGGKRTGDADKTNAPVAVAPEPTGAELLARAKDDSLTTAQRIRYARQVGAKYPDTEESRAATALIAELRETERQENIGKQWSYTAHESEMTGKKTFFAAVYSTNTHTFDFPYEGAQHASLTILSGARQGNDVMFSIERGQLQCRSYSGCQVLVRFDEAEPRHYNARGTRDYSNDTLFIEGTADFMRRMQAAKLVRIQADVYKEGSPTWQFDVSGFAPEKMK